MTLLRYRGGVACAQIIGWRQRRLSHAVNGAIALAIAAD
jgi:hypothetical protein